MKNIEPSNAFANSASDAVTASPSPKPAISEPSDLLTLSELDSLRQDMVEARQFYLAKTRQSIGKDFAVHTLPPTTP